MFHTNIYKIISKTIDHSVQGGLKGIFFHSQEMLKHHLLMSFAQMLMVIQRC